jgi:pimeloyl-ACP methyl ester carboxylesterase
MDKDVQLLKVDSATPDSARAKSLDVIFIHGLGGDHVETWKPPSGDTWPQRVANAHPDVQVWVLSYPAKIGEAFSIGDVDQLGTRGLAVLAAQRMVDNEIGKQPAVLVCHSLGGLLAKRILLDARSMDPANRDRFRHEGVKAVIFCATPHRGSALADVLRWVERTKDIGPRAVMFGLGLDGARYAGWVGRRFLKTSDLIKELEKNHVDLQHLNEDFRGYYEARGGSDFIVRVYAETKGVDLKFFSGPLVVPVESADPNLKFGSWPKVPVLCVTDKNHSELVKPTTDDDWVVEGLDALIRVVREEEFELGLKEGWLRRVGMLVHSELFKCQDLLKISCFQKMLKSKPQMVAEHLHVARQLAAVQGEAVLDLLAELGLGVDEIPRDHGRFDELCDGLTRIGCVLLLAYMQEEVDCPAGPGEVLKIEVPTWKNVEQLFLMAEILHASLRNWPVKLQVKEGRLLPGSWLLSASGQAPRTWRDQDHLNHLANRILDPLAARKQPDELAGLDQKRWPKKTPKPGSDADEERLEEAHDRLEALLRYQMGVVLDAHGSDSPYKDPSMREQLSRAFGDLIALMLPAPDDAFGRDKKRMLSKARANILLFLVKAQNIKVKSR